VIKIISFKSTKLFLNEANDDSFSNKIPFFMHKRILYHLKNCTRLKASWLKVLRTKPLRKSETTQAIGNLRGNRNCQVEGVKEMSIC
jgi:hypothetical protein